MPNLVMVMPYQAYIRKAQAEGFRILNGIEQRLCPTEQFVAIRAFDKADIFH